MTDQNYNITDSLYIVLKLAKAEIFLISCHNFLPVSQIIMVRMEF